MMYPLESLESRLSKMKRLKNREAISSRKLTSFERVMRWLAMFPLFVPTRTQERHKKACRTIVLWSEKRL